MKRRVSILIVFIIVTAMILGACQGSNNQPQGNAEVPSTSASGDESSGGQTTKDTLVVVSNQDPKDLNPYKSQSEQSARVVNHIFERLVDPGKEIGTFEPVLATKWEVIDDGMGMIFYLREGVKFHNGEEMKASDVVFSFKTMKNEANANGGINWIDWDNVEALDDYTVKIPFTQKNSLTLHYLSANNMYVVSEKAFTEFGENIGENPVGTGAFKMTKHVMGDRVEMERNEDYWGEKPVIKKFTIRFISESSQALIALENGEVDMILNLTGTDKKHIEEKPDKLKIIQAASQRCDAVMLNVSKPPFDNIKVRQAVAYVVNQEDIFRATYQQVGRIGHGIISPDIWGYNPEVENLWPYTEDIEKAKQLMAEAGYANGVDVDLLIDDNAFRITTAEIVKNQLGKIGINAHITSTDFASWYDELYKGNGNLFLQGVSTPSGEPDSALYLRFHKSVAKDGGTNMTRFKSDEFSELLDKARASFDNNEKLQFYARAQEILIEELPLVPYYVYPTEFAANINLEGIRPIGKSFYAKDAHFK